MTTNRSDAARVALRNQHLSPTHVESIIKSLSEAGLLDERANSGELRAAAAALNARKLVPLRSALQASEERPQNAKLVYELHARAKRMNFNMPLDRPLTLWEVDQALEGQDVTERIAFKSACKRLKIL
jgi:hypothetical protein